MSFQTVHWFQVRSLSLVFVLMLKVCKFTDLNIKHLQKLIAMSLLHTKRCAFFFFFFMSSFLCHIINAALPIEKVRGTESRSSFTSALCCFSLRAWALRKSTSVILPSVLSDLSVGLAHCDLVSCCEGFQWCSCFRPWLPQRALWGLI